MAKPRKTALIDRAKHPEAYPEQLPEFATDEEAAEFFDSHSAAPYLDQMEEVTEQVTVQRKKNRTEWPAPTSVAPAT